jgi:DHA1 family multidrug resistance protein-like MFS transporter
MRQRLFVILNLSLVSGFVILGVSIVSPVLPQYALSFSIPVALVGWAVSAFALARVVMDIPAGFLADRFGRKRNMMFGLILIILSSIAAGTANNYGWLILARIVQGIGSALYVTSATTWVAQVAAGESRGRYMSLYSGLIFAGASFGPTIGGYTAVHFGLRAPFFAYAVFAFIGIMATLPLKETADSAQTTQSKMRIKDVPSVLLNGPFLLVVTSLCTFPSGILSDKVGRKKPIMACLFLSGIAALLIPSQASLNNLIGIMAFYGLATGLQGSIAAWPADVAPKDKLGTSMGVYRVMGDIGMVLGPITVSYVADYTGHLTVTFAPFLIPALLCFVVGVLMIWARDPAAKKHFEEFTIQ